VTFQRKKLTARKKKNKRKRRRLKRTNKDSLTPLPMDLKLKLVSFLTRSETMRLGRCSRWLNRELISDNVWKAFIMRLSPSLLALPMRAVCNWRDKFKVFLKEPIRKNNNKLRLHFILKVDGCVHSATLSNPRMDKDDEEDQLMRFFSGQDFKSNIPCDRVLYGSIMLLLTYDGMTSVLLPESHLYNNLDFLLGNKLSLTFLGQMVGHLTVWVSINFKWFLTDLTSSDEDVDVELEDGYDDFTGVESLAFNVSRVVDVFGEEIETLDMDTLIAESLKWY